jgi:hypothetical protein
MNMYFDISDISFVAERRGAPSYLRRTTIARIDGIAELFSRVAIASPPQPRRSRELVLPNIRSNGKNGVMTAATLLDALRDAGDAVRAAAAAEWSTADDAELRELIGAATTLRREAERHAALGAAEVARRSSAELGLAGFAQRAGHRTVEEFLRVETGVTGRDAASTARAGALLTEGGPLAEALRGGEVSVPAAVAIQAGLGPATDSVPGELLDQAAERLCDEAAALDPDRLQRRAREVRDELDEAGVAGREAARRAARSLRLVRQADGMTRIVWLLDPESTAIVTEVYDRATSPRRGGPRFVDPDARAAAARLADDERSTEQLASDAFTELLRQSATIGSEVLLGGGEPSVRVLVSAAALESGTGHGALESGEAVAVTTVHRLACAAGVLPIVLDRDGRVLDLGRAQRLFSRRQRQALAVRDGGCLWPGCERPPSWTEAHHITPWSLGGRTDLADGVLLCRHHHLRRHDEGWAITRRAGRSWLEPPPGAGRGGAMLATKSRAVRELLETG